MNLRFIAILNTPISTVYLITFYKRFAKSISSKKHHRIIIMYYDKDVTFSESFRFSLTYCNLTVQNIEL